MDTRHLAWAGGFFEAEGSVSHHLPAGRKTCRATIDVSQKGDGTAPMVLTHFRDVIGGGSIFGPYRGYLYYWRTHDAGLMASTLALLWPWLSTERRAQIGTTLNAVPALWCAKPMGEIWSSYAEAANGSDERRAWAAGFFEGDGSVSAYVGRTRRSSPSAAGRVDQPSCN